MKPILFVALAVLAALPPVLWSVRDAFLVASIAGSVAMLGCAAIVMWKRRPGHAERARLAAEAAGTAGNPDGDEDGPIAPVSPLPPMRELVPPVDRTLLAEADDLRAPTPGEENVPRWLRPSVRQARFAYDRDHRTSFD